MRKQTEGDNLQRRRAAKDAREAGRTPSESGATTGASKQRHHMESATDHDERLANVRRAKLPSAGQPRPNTRPRSARG